MSIPYSLARMKISMLYPRDQERDFGIFERNGVDIVYAPAIDVIYPDGFGVTVTVSKLTECLCGTSDQAISMV